MARRRARRHAAWLPLALCAALALPRCLDASGEGDAEELAALAAAKSRHGHEVSSFPPEPGAAPPSRSAAAPAQRKEDKKKATAQQRLSIAILTLKSAFVEPNVKSNDAVCNPDDAPDPCHCARTAARRPRPAPCPRREGRTRAARRSAALAHARRCVMRLRRGRRIRAHATDARARRADVLTTDDCESTDQRIDCASTPAAAPAARAAATRARSDASQLC